MTLRLGALHDALLDPGNAEKAQKAAEEVAGYENRLGAIESRLASIEQRAASIEQRLTLVTWVLSVVLTVVVFGLSLSFQILGRLPR